MSLPESDTTASAQQALAAGEFDRAIEIARTLTAADSSNYDAWQVLGVAYSQLGQRQEAVEAFRGCVRQRPNIPQSHFNLAQAYLAMGDREKGRSELEVCLSVDPTYIKASQLLSQLGPAPGIGGIGVPGVNDEQIGMVATQQMSGFAPQGMPAQAAAVPGFQAGSAPSAMPAGQAQVSFQPGPAPGQQPGQYTQTGFAGGTQGLAGGQGVPPSSGFSPGFQTMVRQSGPPRLPGSAQAWAISAIVLASIGELFDVVGLVGGKSNVILHMLLAAIFLAGGIGVLKLQTWGRILLIIAAVLGNLFGLLFLAVGAIIALAPQVMGSIPGMQGSGISVAGAAAIGGAIVAAAGVVFLAYNIGLMVSMLSARTKEAMRG